MGPPRWVVRRPAVPSYRACLRYSPVVRINGRLRVPDPVTRPRSVTRRPVPIPRPMPPSIRMAVAVVSPRLLPIRPRRGRAPAPQALRASTRVVAVVGVPWVTRATSRGKIGSGVSSVVGISPVRAVSVPPTPTARPPAGTPAGALARPLCVVAVELGFASVAARVSIVVASSASLGRNRSSGV